MADRKIAYMDIALIKGAKTNPKTHDLETLQASYARFGQMDAPVLDERTKRLLSGHGRIDALLALKAAGSKLPSGIKKKGDAWLAPVVRGARTKNDREADAYVIAANKTTEIGGWDTPKLNSMLDGFESFDGTGFDPPKAEVVETTISELPTSPITKRGDLWDMGDHILLCGDCRNLSDVKRVVDRSSVNVAFTSPPYASQRKYDESSGFKPVHHDDYVEWFKPVQESIAYSMADDASWFLNIKEHCDGGQRSLYVKDLTIAHVRLWGWMFVDEFCWRNTKNGVPGGWNNRFKNAWEPVFHFSRGSHIKFSPLQGKASDNIVVYSSNNSSSKSGSNMLGGERMSTSGIARPSNVIDLPASSLSIHPAMFPRMLPEFFIRAFSFDGDLIFDPFMGSGTTMIAALSNNRRSAGIEISPAYCDVIVDRWESFTGGKATRR